MCRHPAILAPLSGLAEPYSCLIFINPGISASASSISLRPNSANSRLARIRKVSHRCFMFHAMFTNEMQLLVHWDTHRLCREVCHQLQSSCTNSKPSNRTSRFLRISAVQNTCFVSRCLRSTCMLHACTSAVIATLHQYNVSSQEISPCVVWILSISLSVLMQGLCIILQQCTVLRFDRRDLASFLGSNTQFTSLPLSVFHAFHTQPRPFG